MARSMANELVRRLRQACLLSHVCDAASFEEPRDSEGSPRHDVRLPAERKRPLFECFPMFLSAFPMFVPSLSWQMIGF